MEDIRKKRGVCDARRPKPRNQADPSNGGNINNLTSVSSPDSKRANRVHGTLTFREVQDLE